MAMSTAMGFTPKQLWPIGHAAGFLFVCFRRTRECGVDGGEEAEDAKGLIFRVYEWAGKDSTLEFHVPPGRPVATVTNMQETPEGSALAVTGDVVKAPIHPYEILTVRVDYPNGGPKE